MPATDVQLLILIDGEPFGDPIPALMRTPEQIAPATAATVTFPADGELSVEARTMDGELITTMGPQAVTAGYTLSFDPFPEPRQPLPADVRATDMQHQLYRELFDYECAKDLLDPTDDEAIERLRLRVALDVAVGADAARVALERQVRSRIHERWRKQDLPWNDDLCNLWTDTPHVLCGLTPGHPGGHHG